MMLCLMATALAAGGTRCTPIENGTGFEGGDIGSCSLGSFGCCGCCAALDGCSSYTLYDGVCYLKDRSAQPSSCAGCASARLSPPSFDCKVMAGFDIKPDGANVRVKRIPP